MSDARRETTSALPIAQALVASLVGLVLVPALVTPLVGAIEPWALPAGAGQAVWLGLGLAVMIWLLFLAPSLSRAISSTLARAAQSSEADVNTGDRRAVGRWVVALVYVLLAEGVLRRPFVEIAGPRLGPGWADAAFAICVLGLLLLVLYRLHASARTFVEGLALQALDALVATSGSGQEARGQEVVAHLQTVQRASATVPDSGDQRTQAPTPVLATLPASGASAPEAALPAAPGDATQDPRFADTIFGRTDPAQPGR